MTISPYIEVKCVICGKPFLKCRRRNGNRSLASGIKRCNAVVCSKQCAYVRHKYGGVPKKCSICGKMINRTSTKCRDCYAIRKLTGGD